MLHGNWDNRTKEVQFKEILPGGGVREYHGHLEDVLKKRQVEGGIEAEDRFTLIKGTWIWGDRRGGFVCCKERDESSTSILPSSIIQYMYMLF